MSTEAWSFTSPFGEVTVTRTRYTRHFSASSNNEALEYTYTSVDILDIDLPDELFHLIRDAVRAAGPDPNQPAPDLAELARAWPDWAHAGERASMERQRRDAQERDVLLLRDGARRAEAELELVRGLHSAARRDLEEARRELEALRGQLQTAVAERNQLRQLQEQGT